MRYSIKKWLLNVNKNHQNLKENVSLAKVVNIFKRLGSGPQKSNLDGDVCGD